MQPYSDKRYIGGLQELLRETQTQLYQLNPKGSSTNSHANLSHKLRVNEMYETEQTRRHQKSKMLQVFHR